MIAPSFESHQCPAGMWKRQLSCHAGHQEVGRCHTRGEAEGTCTPSPSANKAAPDISRSIQNRGISGPQKGLMSSKNEKKTIIAQLISEQAAVEFEETDSHWANTPLGKHPPPSTTGYGQQVGGKNPTGMHSCCNTFWSTGENQVAPKGFYLYPPTMCVCSSGSRISQRREHYSVSEGTNLLFINPLCTSPPELCKPP